MGLETPGHSQRHFPASAKRHARATVAVALLLWAAGGGSAAAAEHSVDGGGGEQMCPSALAQASSGQGSGVPSLLQTRLGRAPAHADEEAAAAAALNQTEAPKSFSYLQVDAEAGVGGATALQTGVLAGLDYFCAHLGT